MTVERILAWCAGQAARNPKPGYCTGPSRFGPFCFDCSGFTFCAYRAVGYTIPADSASVARWGRANGLVFPMSQARPGDLLVHDKYGQPENSTGPRGHIGIQSTTPGLTWESAGGRKGVGCYPRSPGFWNIAVRHPAFAGGAPLPEAPDLDATQDKLLRDIHADLPQIRDLHAGIDKLQRPTLEKVTATHMLATAIGQGVVRLGEAMFKDGEPNGRLATIIQNLTGKDGAVRSRLDQIIEKLGE